MRFNEIEANPSSPEASAPVVETSVKAKITALLKSLDVQSPKAAKGTGHFDTITLTRAKGIMAASVGPMTATNAWSTNCREVFMKVLRAFQSADFENTQKEVQSWELSSVPDLVIEVPLSPKVTRRIRFSWEKFAAHARSMGYDSGYKNVYFMISVEDVKAAPKV